MKCQPFLSNSGGGGENEANERKIEVIIQIIITSIMTFYDRSAELDTLVEAIESDGLADDLGPAWSLFTLGNLEELLSPPEGSTQ